MRNSNEALASSIESVECAGSGGNEQQTLSVVVPVFNEEAVLPELARQLRSFLPTLEMSWEVLFVDDGSVDRSFEIISNLAKEDDHFRAISFSRNFGHQIAITAGLDHVDSDVTIIMDADLQDPLEVVAEMLAKWREGYEMVYGQRIAREGDSWFKRGTAALFYRILRRLSNLDVPVDAGDFRLLDRKVVAAIKQVRELHRYVRGLVTWVGFRQTSIPYQRQPRAAGETKYPFMKMLLFALDAVTSFSVFPLRIAGLFGLLVAFAGFAGIVWMLYLRLFTSVVVPGLASLFCAVLFLGGTQLAFLGVLGEYLGRVYQECKGRPLYFVREVVGIPRSQRVSIR